MERLAQGLTIFTFVMLCWVAHRTLQVRTQCVNSSFISFVQIGGERVANCAHESRLSLNSLLHPLSEEQTAMLRALEVIEPLRTVLPTERPRLAVEILPDQPHYFELGDGYVRLGRAWLGDRLQTERGLIMGILRKTQPANYTSDFQLEVMTDFLLMSVMSEHEWQNHAVLEDVKFPTSAPSFADYCKSPFRSLAHYSACAMPEPDSADLQKNVWGLRPLVAMALYRAFDHASIRRKLRVMQSVRRGDPLPILSALHETTLPAMVRWFEETVNRDLSALRFPRGPATEAIVKRVMRELDVEAPTRWELTVDITQTPVWREILEQLRTYSHFRKGERTLVFTPEGAVAFPSNLPVHWTAGEVQSQTHVLIACKWPDQKDVVAVTSRHLYARQSCVKVDEVFWN